MGYAQSLRSCFCFPDQEQDITEKPAYEIVSQQPASPAIAYSDDAAAQFIETLRTASKPGKELEAQLKAIASVNGWKESLAESILNGIVKLMQQGAKVAKAMSDAIDRAESKAWEFAKENPGYTALIAAGTLVALGVLAMLAPWVLEALGFEVLGPRAGSYAARWMSSIARSIGNVEKGSFYAYLQSLGMRWGK